MAVVSRHRQCMLLALMLHCTVTTALAQTIFSGTFEYDGVVGAAGTVVQAMDSEGTSLVVSIPAGAVFEDSLFTIEADAAPVGTLARFRLGPAGTRFHEPITLELFPGLGAKPQDLSLSLTGASGRTYLPFTAQDASLSVELLALGYDVDLAKTVESVAIEAQPIDCPEALDSANGYLDFMTTFGLSISSVAQMRDAYLAAQDCFATENPVELIPLNTSIAQAACPAGDTALQNFQEADLVEVNDVETLRQLASNVLAAEGAMQLVGAECDAAGKALPTIENAYQVFIENFKERLASDDFLEGPGAWETHWAHEFSQTSALISDGSLLGLDSIVTQTKSFLKPKILDEFRLVAYKACQTDNTQQYLADVRSGGFLGGHPIGADNTVPDWATFTSSEIERDIQYCRSQLDVEAYEALGDIIPGQGVSLGGLGPGLEDNEAEVSVPVDGTIVLDGPITALRCAYGPESAYFDQDKLIITVKTDTESAVLGELLPISGNLLNNHFDVDIPEVLEALDLPEAGGEFELIVSRHSPACEGTYGPVESPDDPTWQFELFRLTVEAGEDDALLCYAGNLHTWFNSDDGKNDAYNSPNPDSRQIQSNGDGGYTRAISTSTPTNLVAEVVVSGDYGSGESGSGVDGFQLWGFEQLAAVLTADIKLAPGTIGSISVGGYVQHTECTGASSENGECHFSGYAQFCKPSSDEPGYCDGQTEKTGVLANFSLEQALQIDITPSNPLTLFNGRVDLWISAQYSGGSGHVKVNISTDSFQPFKASSRPTAKGTVDQCITVD